VILASPIIAHFSEYAYQKYFLQILQEEEKGLYPTTLSKYQLKKVRKKIIINYLFSKITERLNSISSNNINTF